MSKRPTDHLEPSAKKRTNNRQLTKDDPSDEDADEVDPGTFQRASEDILKARRIVKTRRNAPASVAASANPFSGVSLAVPSVQSASASNPVNSGTDSVPRMASEEAEQTVAAPGASSAQAAAAEAAPAVDAAAAQSNAAAEAAVEHVTGGSSVAETAAPAVSNAPVGATGSTPAPDVVASSAPTTFASFAASNTASPFGTLSASGGSGAGFGFGSADGGALGNGSAFGAVGSAAGAPGAFGFGSAASAVAAGSEAAPGGQFRFQPAGSAAGGGGGFSFATAPASGGFPSVQSIFGASGPAAATSLFGGTGGSNGSGALSGRPAAAAVLAPEEARVTGEEAESAAFSGDGVLYEFSSEGQWRERGRGELKVNVALGGQARLVMRARGNLRLLLNANLWPDMKVTLMDGGKGVTFACINAAAKSAENGPEKVEASKPAEGNGAEAQEPLKKEADQPKAAEEPKLAMFAFRVKERARLNEFIEAVEAHKAGAQAAKAQE